MPSPTLGLMASGQVEAYLEHSLQALEIHSLHRSVPGRACKSHLVPSPGCAHRPSSCGEQSPVVGIDSGTGCSGSGGTQKFWLERREGEASPGLLGAVLPQAEGGAFLVAGKGWARPTSQGRRALRRTLPSGV